MKEIQKKFEEYAVDFDLALTPDGKEYALHETCVAWHAWQASRLHIIVDVSSLPSASYVSDSVVYRSGVEKMLDDLGVQCK